MNLRERYYVLDLYTKAMTVFWLPFIIIMMFLGLSIGWQIHGFVFGFFNAFLFGLVLGLPMVLFGQAAGAFLDQAEMLVNLKEEAEEDN
ncbi:MAG: hypothetical protein ACR2IE_13020 [Candidatus Sumerlaeaceae bacterium]